MKTFRYFSATLLVGASLICGVAQASATTGGSTASAPPVPTSCSGTGTACAYQQPNTGRVDLRLTGSSGTKALSGICPVSKPQFFQMIPPFTLLSYTNRSQCPITLVDDQHKRHSLPVGSGEVPGGLRIIKVIVDPVGPGRQL